MPNHSSMRLSIIIVNYKTPQLTLDCISSIYEQGGDDEPEVIVVDNDSGDQLDQLLAAKFPRTRFHQMGYNAGFARANNAGIRIAIGDAVLLLNSDTIVLNNAVNNAFQQLMGSPYLACGVQLLNADGSPQISGNYAMRGGVNYLLPLPYLGPFLKAIAGTIGVKKPNVPNATGVTEVDWINGAFLMVKRDAIQRAGLLDEDFFLYAEEAEWCSRIRKIGPLCIYGDCHVIHLQGVSANEAFNSEGKGYFNLFDKKGLQIMVSNFLRIRKQFGLGWFLFDLAVYIFEIPVFFIGLLICTIFRVKTPYTFRQAVAYCKNIFSLVGYAPTMIANKRYFYKIL